MLRPVLKAALKSAAVSAGKRFLAHLRQVRKERGRGR